jgi:hypothetical protein
MSPVQQNDSQICSTCIHRLYTNEKELYCRKGLDSNNVMFFCNDYSSEITYENKDYLKFRDKSEYSLRKVQIVFVCITTILLLSLFLTVYETDESSTNISMIISCLICLGLFYRIYKGRKWAKFMNNISISTSLFICMVEIGSDTDGSIENLIANIIAVLVGIYLLYFFNLDKDFVKHFNSQRK